jgi:hypothetical protein
MDQFGKLLFMFVITIVLFVTGGNIVFNFMESQLMTVLVILWAAVTIVFTIVNLRSDMSKLPFFLGLIVSIVIVLVQKGVLQM